MQEKDLEKPTSTQFLAMMDFLRYISFELQLIAKIESLDERDKRMSELAHEIFKTVQIISKNIG